MKLHYLQHVQFENPGTILTWAKEHNCIVTSTHFYDDGELPTQKDYDWLVVMGGPMNILDEENYPWLAREKIFIREAIDSGKVVIGICLGAQLIAHVIGGTVTKNPNLEIGWFPVTLSRNSRNSPIFSFFPQKPMVFQWHGDTFNNLPEDAICIAGNEACSHQAFMYNERVFGFQFHLESTKKIIEDLVSNCENEMLPGVFVQSKEELSSHPEYIQQINEWMDMFLTQLEKMDNDGAEL